MWAISNAANRQGILKTAVPIMSIYLEMFSRAMHTDFSGAEGVGHGDVVQVEGWLLGGRNKIFSLSKVIQVPSLQMP